jgi:hypothetical protein
MGVDLTHPYQVHFEKDRYRQVEDMMGWCIDNIGEGGYIFSTNNIERRWALVLAFGKSSWLFKNQDDATMFALRWT